MNVTEREITFEDILADVAEGAKHVEPIRAPFALPGEGADGGAEDVDWFLSTIKGATARDRLWYLHQLLECMHPDNANVVINYWQAKSPGEFDLRTGFIAASDIPPTKDTRRLWLGMYPGCVTLLNGETGAGKSVVLLNVAVHAALNEPLWDIPFGIERPLRVLYVDPENAGNFSEGDGGIVATRLERLGMGRPPGLMFHDGKGLNLRNATHVAQMIALTKEQGVDLLILDPYVNLFATTNENDNREAYENMKALNALARSTGCAVVLCHHTGKMNEEMGGASSKFGRGASSLLGAADVGMTLRVRKRGGDSNDDDGRSDSRQRDDICRLKVEKNRLVGELTSVYLQMAGNERFNRVTASEFFDNGSAVPKGIDKSRQARALFDEMLVAGDEFSRKEFVEAARSGGISKDTADSVLNELVTEGVAVTRNGPHGSHLYRRSDSSFQFPTSLIGAAETGNCDESTRDPLTGEYPSEKREWEEGS